MLDHVNQKRVMDSAKLAVKCADFTPHTWDVCDVKSYKLKESHGQFNLCLTSLLLDRVNQKRVMDSLTWSV